MSVDCTATITAPGFETLAVCLCCYGEVRSWRPETIEAFRAWHTDRCGGEKPQVTAGIMGSERPRAARTAGARPTPTEEVGRD